MESFDTTLDAVCLASRIILESGGETYRAEETVEKMCQGLHIPHVEVLALPTGLMLTLMTEDGASVSRIVRVRHRSTDLKRVDDCNAVSRQVAAGQMNAGEALEKLGEIHCAPALRLPWMVPVGALSAASFTIMLGGGWLDFCVSFVCGAVVQLALPVLSRRRMPGMLGGLVVGFLITLITMVSTLFSSAINIEPIISGAVMPMLPGLATTNAIRDTIRGDLVSGGARFTEALLTAVMLAAGICIMLSMWGGMGL